MTAVATVRETRRRCSSDRRFGRTHRSRHFPCRFRAEQRLHSDCARRRSCRRHRARSAQELSEAELRPARIARRGIGKEEWAGAGKPRPRPGRWSAVLPLFLPRRPRPRDTDCPWSLRQPGCSDVSRVHDEGGVDVRSCHCQVKGESVWIARDTRGALRFSSCVRTGPDDITLVWIAR
jgi:hypothetical protein